MINRTGARLLKHVAALLILLGLSLAVVAAVAPAGDATRRGGGPRSLA
jgi:hypothetical protein